MIIIIIRMSGIQTNCVPALQYGVEAEIYVIKNIQYIPTLVKWANGTTTDSIDGNLILLCPSPIILDNYAINLVPEREWKRRMREQELPWK